MWKFFVKNVRFTITVVLALSIAGLVSMLTIPKESNPEVVIPFVVVSTPFPGASALDVEQFVTNEIEDVVLGLEDTVEVTSTSAIGASTVAIEFEIGSDIDKKIADVKDAVDLAQAELPSDALDPIVQEVSFDDSPIKTYALAGPYDAAQLRKAAEDLKDELERIPGLTEASVIGGEGRELRAIVSEDALRQYDLSLQAFLGALRGADSNIPVGTIVRGSSELSVRFDASINRIEQLSDIVISSQNGVNIYFTDIVEIVDGYSERRASSRLTNDTVESESAVVIQIFKKSGGNILEIVDAADAEFERAKSDYLPQGITVEIVDDTAQFIRDDLRNLSLSGLQTTIIVIVFIFLLLGVRESLLAGLAIPLTFLITFIFLSALGFTLNFLSLFSLILSLGILVDAAIVMTEGVYANIERGLGPQGAALATIDEFRIPLLSGTATTIFAFLPMLLTSGIIGQFIKSIPVTVSIVLLSALFVAIALIPTFAMILLSRKKKQRSGYFTRKVASLKARLQIDERYKRFVDWRDDQFAQVQSWYRNILNSYLTNSRRAKWFVRGILLAFILSLALPISGLLKVDMFPRTDMDNVYVDIELPEGSILSETEKVVSQIESYLKNRDEIRYFLVSAGSGSNVSGGRGSNIGSATIRLIDGKRPDSRILTEQYQADLETQITNADIVVQQLGSGPEQGAPVEVQIIGPELEVLESLANDIEALLSGIDGTRNVDTSVDLSAGEYALSVNRSVAASYGVAPSDIATVLRTAVFGSDVLTVSDGGEDLDVVLKYDLGQDISADNREIQLERILGIAITTPFGDVPLSTFVTASLEPSRTAISHEDGDRIVRVTSQIRQGFLAADIFTELNRQLPSIAVPDGYMVSAGGQNEETDESFADLGRAMILGIILIAGLLILQFNSFRQPLIVISSIPLALIGVLPGLTMINQPLSFPGMIGVVALAGIVVNNGIILLDKMNENRRDGASKSQAIELAAVARLRPILLTTVTTVAGLLPLVLTQPSWAPLGFAIIFGLLFSTVLTLLVVPILYLIFAENEIE
jgi:HAE1 family hydrophobic/amphiphilic exporter-1